MSDSPLISRLIRVSGRVQGVGYRAWTEREARSRGLAGWVRNRRDGTVEALFVGLEADVTAMVEACRKGPGAAEVSAISVESVAARTSEIGFQQLPTA